MCFATVALYTGFRARIRDHVQWPNNLRSEDFSSDGLVNGFVLRLLYSKPIESRCIHRNRLLILEITGGVKRYNCRAPERLYATNAFVARIHNTVIPKEIN